LPRSPAIRAPALRLRARLAALVLGLLPVSPLAAPPPLLSQTGLYARIQQREIAPGVLPYAPQYPLWTDGAAKRRWIWLPPGAFIDASDPAAWRFPVGTRFWKEFSFGRRVETRFIEKQADGSWLFATYLWDAAEQDAALAPVRGVTGIVEIQPGARHDIPGVADCRVCHEGRPDRVLGFDAIQLSPERDPQALHADPAPEGGLDLASLAARGLLRGLPAETLARPPRIPARSPVERAALGYLVGNCSHCHSSRGALAPLGLSFEHDLSARAPSDEPAIRTTVGRPGTFALPGERATELRIAPGDPAHSLAVARMASRDAVTQMPPLGTHVVDRGAVDLVSRWIEEDLKH
jgi:hypothetical protein